MQSLLKNKTVLIIVGLIVALILGIVGYALTNRKPVLLPVNQPEVNLIWWKTDADSRTYDNIIKSFKSIDGNQKVSIQIVKPEFKDEYEYHRILLEAFAKGQGPDIFTLRNDDIISFIDYLTPITGVQRFTDTELLTNYRNSYVDLVVRDTVYREQIYGITGSVDSIQMYYNKDLLTQADIPLPAQNWERFNQDVTKLSIRNTNSTTFRQSGVGMGTGLLKKGGDLDLDRNVAIYEDIIPLLVFQNGGQLYDYPTRKSVFQTGNNSAINEAVNYYLSFSNPTSSRYSWSTDSESNEEMFLKGKVGYIFQYKAFENTIKAKNNRLNYAVAEIPQINPERKKTYGRFYADVINRQLERSFQLNPKDITAANKLQKAREFMYFLSTEFSQNIYTSATNTPSSHRAIIQRQLSGQESLQIFARGSLYADNYYKPDVDRVERIWGEMLYRIQFENEPINTSISKAGQEYAILVNQGARIRFR
jgi:ABC-type glycerol-3-phosphate transport system substrate-binding protein